MRPDGRVSGRNLSLLGCFLVRRRQSLIWKRFNVASFIEPGAGVDNTAKVLELEDFLNAFIFNDLVGFPGLEFLVLLALPAGPFHDHAVNHVLLAHAKRYGNSDCDK